MPQVKTTKIDLIQPSQGPKYNLSVYVHVGTNSLREAQDMVDYAMALTYNTTNIHLKGDFENSYEDSW